MEDLDLILAPTIPTVAPRAGIGDLELRGRMLSLTFAWNAVGGPALALPCGSAEDGLPASVQLIGRPGEDALVLAAGRLLEAELTPWRLPLSGIRLLRVEGSRSGRRRPARRELEHAWASDKRRWIDSEGGKTGDRRVNFLR